ncbi:MAG: pilin [Candidatus Saccharibacteria bacterium]|nr:pilin [Candidatus Saccharibacteria bacterium]
MSKIKDIAKEAGAALTVAALTVATTGVRVFAEEGTAGSDGGGGGAVATQRAKTGVDNVNPGAETDLNGMISTILNVVFGVVGIVAVIMIILGGVNYTVSQGDSQKIQKAKNTIMYGIIGLVVVLLAFAIVNFVLNGLLGK